MARAQVTPFRTNFDGTHPFSSVGAKFWLASGVGLSWTVPGDPDQQYRASFTFSSNIDVWVKLNGANIVPVAGTVVDSYNEQLNPDFLYVSGGDVLHFISTDTPQVGVTLLSVPS